MGAEMNGDDGKAQPEHGVSLEDLIDPVRLKELEERRRRQRTSSRFNLALGFAAFGVGAYKGFCDGHGIPMDNHSVEMMLMYGPTALQSLVGVVKSVPYGAVGGGVLGATLGMELSETTSGRLAAVGIGTTGGIVLATAIGVTAWGGKGALQTLCGYLPGYALGWMTR